MEGRHEVVQGPLHGPHLREDLCSWLGTGGQRPRELPWERQFQPNPRLALGRAPTRMDSALPLTDVCGLRSLWRAICCGIWKMSQGDHVWDVAGGHGRRDILEWTRYAGVKDLDVEEL